MPSGGYAGEVAAGVEGGRRRTGVALLGVALLGVALRV